MFGPRSYEVNSGRLTSRGSTNSSKILPAPPQTAGLNQRAAVHALCAQRWFKIFLLGSLLIRPALAEIGYALTSLVSCKLPLLIGLRKGRERGSKAEHSSISSMKGPSALYLFTFALALLQITAQYQAAIPGKTQSICEYAGNGGRGAKYGSGSDLIAPPSRKVPYGPLSINWWRWAYDAEPDTFSDNVACGGDQKYTLPDGTPMFFLAGITFDNNTVGPVNVFRSKNCIVPKNAYVMIPVLNIAAWFDLADPNDHYKVSDTENTTDPIRVFNIVNPMGNCKKFSLEVDGQLVTKAGFAATSPVVDDFTAPPNEAGGPSIPNTHAAALGIWNVLRPLSKGRHVIRACTTVDNKHNNGTDFLLFCVQYNLAVSGGRRG
jgi:hypothetical protein